MKEANPYAAIEKLLRTVAATTLDYARARNKAGVIRMRYLAHQLLDMLPSRRATRLSDRSFTENRAVPVPDRPAKRRNKT